MNKHATTNYYETQADTYFKTTYTIDMSQTCDRFLKYIPTGGTIIDIGCGSGRDLKYFSAKGFLAEGLDASRVLCQKAEQYTGVPIHCAQMQDWRPEPSFDGIWCCASLLHLTEDEIFSFLQRASQALKPEGVIFISAKCGIDTGYDAQGRYFTNFSPELIRGISEKIPAMNLAEQWYTADKLGRIDINWVNLIYRKMTGGCSPK